MRVATISLLFLCLAAPGTSCGLFSPPAEASPTEDFRPREPAEAVRIGTGDVLEVQVFGLSELDRKVIVQPGGVIHLPLLGEVEVEGMSSAEAAEEIASLLAESQVATDPQVSVFVAEFRSRSVSIQGAVRRPGAYQLVANRKLLHLVAEAGGLTDNAGDWILVVRDRPGEVRERREIETRRLLDEGDLDVNVTLLPGDVVLVPRKRVHKVYVSGEVRRPGVVEYESTDGMTVLQAVIAAGGTTERANLRRVVVVRSLPDGTRERIQVDLKDVRRGRVEDVILSANDTVVVEESFF